MPSTRERSLEGICIALEIDLETTETKKPSVKMTTGSHGADGLSNDQLRMTVTIDISGIEGAQREVQSMVADGDWITDIYPSFIGSLNMLKSRVSMGTQGCHSGIP